MEGLTIIKTYLDKTVTEKMQGDEFLKLINDFKKEQLVNQPDPLKVLIVILF